MNWPTKLLLAALSGCLVMMLWHSVGDSETFLTPYGFYGLCGFVFAVGVLLPYVSREHLVSWRPPVLVIVSGASFYSAIYIASELSAAMKGPELEDFVYASLVGAAVVLATTPFILSFKVTRRYVASSVVAALVAGVVFGLLAETNLYGFMLGFACWHAAIAGVLHISCSVDANDGWLASLQRKRFTAVTGAISLLVIVPLVDDAIGATILYRHQSDDGGLRMHETFTAHGFRDEREPSMFPSYGCGFRCVGRVQDETYSFQEYAVDSADGRFVVFYLADAADANCHRYGGTWQPPIEPVIKGSSQTNGRCLAFRVSDGAAAIYAVRKESNRIDALFGLYPLRRINRRVIRLSDGKLMSEVTYHIYDTRFFDDSIGEIESWQDFLAKALPPAGGDWLAPH